jgi:hypothetical protein
MCARLALLSQLAFPGFGVSALLNLSGFHSGPQNRTKDCSSIRPRSPPVSLVERRWGALLGLWEILLETCPELGTPAIPGRPSQLRSFPDAAFRWADGVGITAIFDFGAESSRPACLLCTLRTYQSPGEWQHSLSACSLSLT